MYEALKILFKDTFGLEPVDVQALPASGSHRRYYRLSAPDHVAIGVIGTDADENKAFISLCRHFHAKGIRVPELLAVSEDGMCYLQQDLGDVSLYDGVARGRSAGEYSSAEQEMLCRAMAGLPKMQFEGAEGIDWSVCYPSPVFDRQQIEFDLNYFKYCFLKTYGVEFNEIELQRDLDAFRDDLLQEPCDTFLYRDFQSRNVMLSGGEPYYIDFQGGRRGPMFYDVASFVWQARARYPGGLKERLIDAYLEALQPYRRMSGGEFRRRLAPFVLFRCMQTLGAYGFRGLVERKPYFISAIPAAIEGIKALRPLKYPCLDSIIASLQPPIRESLPQEVQPRLEVDVMSFSYRKGLPEDPYGNGGGYIFDCRSIHNPGRYDEYKQLCGRDAEVIRFLQRETAMDAFLEHVRALVDAHVRKYLARGFEHLQICFGCTGGQHRSVYSAEQTAIWLAQTFPGVRVHLIHRELSIDERL